MSILVVGSLCIDHTLFVPTLPNPGETVIAHSSLESFGGKGANQALAARQTGSEVSFIGCTGNDASGDAYRKHFSNYGINPDSMVCSSNDPTGSAFLGVDSRGENLIMINPGANHALRPKHLDQHLALFQKASHLLLQLEIAFETIEHACKLAQKYQIKTIINPSPWHIDFNTQRFCCNYLIVNEHEAAAFFHQEPQSLTPKILEQHQLETLIITRGAESTIALDKKEGRIEILPKKVNPIDTVGAGDTFTGALATSLSEGSPLSQAIHFANTAAALSTLTAGAQGAIPNKIQIERAL